MAEYKGLSGNSYRLQNAPFAGGGEGDVYDVVGAPGYVAKVYKPDKRTTERERKLSIMVFNKPSVMEQYAWPLDVLYENGQFIGYIMPKINGKEKLRNIYVYDKRKGKPWSLFIAIAKNLSAAVHNVHEIHQVVGDLNPENILVNPNDGMVTLVDTDSYHISDSSRTYRCGVGMPEFVAPELQGIHFPSALLPTFTPESDRFALAVLIFALLMNGAHPFSCKVISGSSSKFQPIDNMQNGKCAFFPDSRSSNMDIPRYAPELSSLPDNIQKLFWRAFVAGHRTPSLRPSAEEWYNALEQLEDNLKTCLKDTQHIYYYGAKECPWCKVNEKMHSISPSAFNSSSQSGSNSGSGSQPATAGGQAQQFTPSNYRYTPSSSGSGTQNSRKRYGGWIAIGVAVIVLIIIIKSCLSGGDAGKQNSSPSSQNTPTSTQNETVNQETSRPNSTPPSETVKSTIESGFEVEDNNTYLRANDVLVNNKYSGSLSASHASEQDWYCFNLKEAGEVIVNFYTKSQPSSGAYWDISVRSGNNPNSDVWQTFVNGDATTTKSSELYLSAGSYYFEVESSNNHTTDSYSFEIKFSELKPYSAQEIQDGKYVAEDLNLQTVSCSPANVLQWNGNFTSEKQTDEFSFTAERNGVYSIFFTNILEGQEFPIQVLDASGKAISNQYMSYSYGLAEGVDLTLNQGQQYTIKVRQSSNYYGAYCLNVGQQKEYIDISNCYAVYDTVDFIKQENGYYFTPSVTGEYRFGFSDIPEGFEYCIQVVNSGGNAISNQYWSYSYGNKEGTTVKLTAGQTYLIKVKQYSTYYGDYCLDVGLYKNTGDISSFFAVDDSIQHIGQRNLYTFVPELTASYEFGISNVPEGCKYLIQVVNSGGNAISNQYWSYSYGNNERQSVNLSKGQVYTVIVRPASNAFGSYTLNIGTYKDPVDISDYDYVSDSMQYRLQRNQYTFTPRTTGTYSFILSNVPSGYEYLLQVWNAAGDAISNQYWSYSYGDGESQSVDLTGGQTYTIIVRQNSTYLSDYVLTVKPK